MKEGYMKPLSEIYLMFCVGMIWMLKKIREMLSITLYEVIPSVSCRG